VLLGSELDLSRSSLPYRNDVLVHLNVRTLIPVLSPAINFSSFVAFGVGLDPRQAELFGPVIGPCLVGCTLGLASFASAGLIPGFAGAGMNPARCFAFAVARGNFRGM
jgi:hypothetical protein